MASRSTRSRPACGPRTSMPVRQRSAETQPRRRRVPSGSPCSRTTAPPASCSRGTARSCRGERRSASRLTHAAGSLNSAGSSHDGTAPPRGRTADNRSRALAPRFLDISERWLMPVLPRRANLSRVTALAQLSAASEIRPVAHACDRSAAHDRLWLWAGDAGWSLVARDGGIVFAGNGLTSRRQCLQHAHDLGVLAVLD